MFKYTEIGIDLGEAEMKLVEIDKSKDGEVNNLKNYESYPVQSELYTDEYFDELKANIKDFSKQIKKRRLSLNITLPLNEYSRIMKLTMPTVDRKDLNDGIILEVNRLLANEGVSNHKIKWKIIDTYEELNEHEVLIATLSNEVIDKLTQFKKLNMRVNKLELQPTMLETFVKGNDVIVDSGDKNTRVYMYHDGKLSKTDQVSSGGSLVREAIVDYIEDNLLEPTEYDELINEIYMYNAMIENDDSHASKISSIIQPEIISILDEIKRIVRSFELQGGLNVDNVYSVGNLTELRYLNETLESELDIDVRPLDALHKEEENVKYDLAGIAAITAGNKSRLDFSTELQANVDYLSILIAILAISLSMMVSLKILNDDFEETISEQQVIISEQNGVLSGVNSDIQEVQAIIDKSNRFMDMIDSLKSKDAWLSDILYAIPDKTPLDTVVKKFSIENGFVEIEGYSADYSSIGFFANALRELGEVDIVSIDDYDGSQMYSVVTDTPETISDRYIMTRRFVITLEHDNQVLD